MKQRLGVQVTPAELDALVEAAESAVQAATVASEKARGALNANFDEVVDTGDELRLKRLRRDVTDTTQAIADAKDNLARIIARRDRTRAANRAQEAAKLRAEVERLAKVHRAQAEAVRTATAHIVTELLAYIGTALKLRLAADALLVEAKALEGPGSRLHTAVSVADFPATFSTERMVGLLAQDLTVDTGGKWPARGVLDIYALSQGPRFDRRVAEEVAILLRTLPHPALDGDPLPPAA